MARKPKLRETLLLVSIPALSVLSASAAHADATLSPTHPLIGGWCDVNGSTLLKRGSCRWGISQDGFGTDEHFCKFLEIKRTRSGIETFSECHHIAGRFIYDKRTFQIIGNRLKTRTVSSQTVEKLKAHGDGSLCVSMQETPLGYLNLRQGPGMNFKVEAKINIGEDIKADAKTDEWTHITDYTLAGGKKVSGWVYSKYITHKDEGLSCTPAYH